MSFVFSGKSKASHEANSEKSGVNILRDVDKFKSEVRAALSQGREFNPGNVIDQETEFVYSEPETAYWAIMAVYHLSYSDIARVPAVYLDRVKGLGLSGYPIEAIEERE
jgi:hypothetical protein